MKLVQSGRWYTLEKADSLADLPGLLPCCLTHPKELNTLNKSEITKFKTIQNDISIAEDGILLKNDKIIIPEVTKECPSQKVSFVKLLGGQVLIK